MCGILLSLSQGHSTVCAKLAAGAENLVSNRGPDFNARHELQIEGYAVKVFSSVLHLRGNSMGEQPVISHSHSSILCWNGEAYTYNDIRLDTEISDTDWLSKELESIPVDAQFEQSLLKYLSFIEGPFAIAYIRNNKLYFARDILGRRSLLFNLNAQGLVLASVAYVGSEPPWQELPAGKLFTVDLTPDWSSRELCGVEFVKQKYHDMINLSIPNYSQLLHYPTNAAGEVIGLPVPGECGIGLSEFAEFHKALSNSIDMRVSYIPGNCDTSIGILFSGGLDCSVIAALADRYVPKSHHIDLLNVAFENPRSLINSSKNDDIYNVPDRLVGLKALEELKMLSPGRQWNFVHINVPFEEYERCKSLVLDLMYPCSSVMDLSIAIAFWFASRGIGSIVNGDGDLVPYESKAKVLLSGLGADELMGGYSRHQQAYLKDGYVALLESLRFDLERIPTRNLGRDDRIVTSHGKEVRFPFLDRKVIETVTKLPVQWKCDQRPTIPRGIGEKLWLRMYAKYILRLETISTEKKRAIQFGARTAKMQVSTERGCDMLCSK